MGMGLASFGSSPRYGAHSLRERITTSTPDGKVAASARTCGECIRLMLYSLQGRRLCETSKNVANSWIPQQSMVRAA